MRKKQATYKILLLGKDEKLQMFMPFMDNTFEPDYKSTIGVQFLTKVIETEEYHVKLVIWDVKGHFKFETYRHLYFKDAEGVIIVENDEDKIKMLKDDILRYTAKDTTIEIIAPGDDVEGLLETLNQKILEKAEKN